MDGAVFDTLRVTKILPDEPILMNLPDAGIGEAQAEAITESIGVALGVVLTGGVATKADLAAMEARLHRYMWIVTGTVVSLAVALLKLLP